MGKKTSKNKQGQYSAYKADLRWLKNRKARVAKHLKSHPNDTQSEQLMSTSYGRGTPNSNTWSHSDKRIAKLFGEVYGRGDNNLFSANHLLVASALKNIAKNVKTLPRQSGNLFSIRERARLVTQ